MDDETHHKTALELGAAIEQGRIDPRELTEYYLDRISNYPARKRLFTHVLKTRARAEAADAAARAKRGLRRSPLDGVPVTYKDLFDIAGVPTTAGSRLLEQNLAARDAMIVQRLAQAGLVTLAKTTMTELAFSGLGINPHFGTPPNAFDRNTERVPGGSSSGAGVAVAEGLCAAAIGTDTGGSVRIPASWNGLTGLKTSFGRVPLEGAVPLSPSLDTIGPLVKDASDAAALFGLLTSNKTPDLASPRLRHLHFLVAEGIGFDSLSPGVGKAVEHTLELLAHRGVKLTRRKLPALEETQRLTWEPPSLLAAEAWGLWGTRIEESPELMYAQVEKRFRMGEGADIAALGAKWKKREELRGAYLAETAGYDAVLMPAVALTPPPIVDLENDDAAYGKANALALRNTTLGNQLDLAALTLPAGKDAAGIPVGLMLMGPSGTDERLLRLARAVEKALHGH